MAWSRHRQRDVARPESASWPPRPSRVATAGENLRKQPACCERNRQGSALSSLQIPRRPSTNLSAREVRSHAPVPHRWGQRVVADHAALDERVAQAGGTARDPGQRSDGRVLRATVQCPHLTHSVMVPRGQPISHRPAGPDRRESPWPSTRLGHRRPAGAPCHRRARRPDDRRQGFGSA